MEKLFINRKPYISPQCEIYEIKFESNILQSSFQEPDVEVIEDGTISQPEQIFSLPRHTFCFEEEDKDK